jgi:hypothetical protein
MLSDNPLKYAFPLAIVSHCTIIPKCHSFSQEKSQQFVVCVAYIQGVVFCAVDPNVCCALLYVALPIPTAVHGTMPSIPRTVTLHTYTAAAAAAAAAAAQIWLLQDNGIRSSGICCM